MDDPIPTAADDIADARLPQGELPYVEDVAPQ